MLKHRAGVILGALLTGTTLLTGCGVQLTELTESERQQIVDYSAHVVSEFNTRQTKGYIALSKEILETLDEPEVSQDDETSVEDLGTSEEGTTENGQEGSENQTVTTTLAQALGIEGLETEGLTYEVVTEYVQGNVFNLSPAEGNCFVMISCNLKNTLADEVMCDIYGSRLEFTIDVNNGGAKTSSLITILDNDLSTMSERLAGGASKPVVLLFEVSQDVASSIETLTLNVKNESTNHSILMK